MNNKFDDLAKGLAQSVTRRGALKKFGLGIAGIALATLGLTNKAQADQGGCRPSGKKCGRDSQCCSGACIFIGPQSRLQSSGSQGFCF